MKKSILSFLMVLVGFISFGQKTFDIKSIGTQYSENQISTTFTNADFCGSYFESKRNKIVLNDGSIVELKSKIELQEAGITLAPSCFIDDATIYNFATWSISENGRLMKGYDSNYTNPEKTHQILKTDR